MDYSKIIAVTGLPGLHELISSKSDGAIVRSLEDKSTKFVSSRIHNFSHLESIEIYTVQDNVNLAEIFQAMEASSEELPDDKDPKAVRSYFEKVFGDIDFERVYNSDMKKMVRWFYILRANQIEIKLSEPEPQPEPEVPALPEKEPVKAKAEEEKPAKASKASQPARAAAPKEEKAPAKKKAPAKPSRKAKEEKPPALKKAATKSTAKSATKSGTKAATKAAAKSAPKKKK